MPNGSADLAHLLHDAAAVHSFVDFIGDYCRERVRSRTYVDSTDIFFKYIEELTVAIKGDLEKQVMRARKFPKRIPVLRSNILTIKYYLRLLHSLIKPAADAHTLTIPAPLITLATEQLGRVERMRNSQVVILLTPELMYFQRSHTQVKDQAHAVESIISSVRFPSGLGFVELPYSQGRSFFTNLAIYHEIGHFVYEELSDLEPPDGAKAQLDTALESSFGNIPGIATKDHQTRAYVHGILESWTQEIFCDLFATRLLGPAFSFALVEILAMLGYLLKSGDMCQRFDPSHPAPAFRFSEQVRLLQAESWMDAISGVDAEQKRIIEQLAATPKSDYTFFYDEQNPGPKSLVDAFVNGVVPAIRELAHGVTKRGASSAKKFINTKAHVQDCLRVGVVPLTNSVPRPDPISIINAAYCFYLTSLRETVTRFEGKQAEDDVSAYSRWAKRLQLWTMKAVEDSLLLMHYNKVRKHDSH
jgi:hypothetical protein